MSNPIISEKQLSDFVWLTLGRRLYQLMHEGKYATVAHAVKKSLDGGVFEPDDSEGSAWRTAILLNYKWDEI